MKQSRVFYQWLLRGGVGASLIGAGVCCTIEVAFAKHAGAEFISWFVLGTLSLAILIAGVCLLIDALRFKIKMDEMKRLQ
jgi:hypothetical protein